MSVQEKLKGLQALQSIDVEVLELKRAGDAHPKRLAVLEQELSGARAAVEAQRALINDNERLRREKQQEIQNEKEKVKKWESRLAEQRTTREYAALAREIDIAKKTNLAQDEDLKALLQQQEDLKKALADREAELRRREDSSAAERADLNAKISQLAGQVKALEEKRAQASQVVDKGVLAKYESVRKKRGTGMAAVVNGICKGCNMRLPPQLQNILRSGATVETCPSCQRLIYAHELMNPPAATT